MELRYDAATSEVEVRAVAAGLRELARIIAAGSGRWSPRASDDVHGSELAAVLVGSTAAARVTVRVDAEDRCLRIDGGQVARQLLADNIEAVADDDHGGHLHVDWFPDHPYLAEGSTPLVIVSPAGGMPGRTADPGTS